MTTIRCAAARVAAALIAVAAIFPTGASASPGDLDLPFGGGDGHVSFSGASLDRDLQALDIEVLSDGRTMVFGSVSLSGGPEIGALVRFDANGLPDPTWNGGQPVVPQGSIAQAAFVLDSEDRVLWRGLNGKLQRYTTSGVLDASFGDRNGTGIIRRFRPR